MKNGWRRRCVASTIVLGAVVFSLSQGSKGASSEIRVGSLPTVFESNVGQAPQRYRFLSRHSSVNAFFLDTGVDLNLPGKEGTCSRVRFHLLASQPDVVPEGANPLVSVSNYLLGNDPARWIRGVPNQSQVIYRRIYPGVDLVFHGRGDELEHDFRIAPGADPRLIRFAIEGAEGLSVDNSGNLKISLSTGRLLFKKP